MRERMPAGPARRPQQPKHRYPAHPSALQTANHALHPQTRAPRRRPATRPQVMPPSLRRPNRPAQTRPPTRKLRQLTRRNKIVHPQRPHRRRIAQTRITPVRHHPPRTNLANILHPPNRRRAHPPPDPSPPHTTPPRFARKSPPEHSPTDACRHPHDASSAPPHPTATPSLSPPDAPPPPAPASRANPLDACEPSSPPPPDAPRTHAPHAPAPRAPPPSRRDPCECAKADATPSPPAPPRCRNCPLPRAPSLSVHQQRVKRHRPAPMQGADRLRKQRVPAVLPQKVRQRVMTHRPPAQRPAAGQIRFTAPRQRPRRDNPLPQRARVQRRTTRARPPRANLREIRAPIQRLTTSHTPGSDASPAPHPQHSPSSAPRPAAARTPAPRAVVLSFAFSCRSAPVSMEKRKPNYTRDCFTGKPLGNASCQALLGESNPAN